MTQKELNEVLRLHKQWLESNGNKGKRAHMHRANLQGAYMQGVNMQGAYMQGVNLQNAHMRDANLKGTDMQGADMQGADMQGVNLQGANMQRADLQNADMRGADRRGTNMKGANLKGANLDYSAWSLWCGSFDVKCDIRLASQLAYHFCRLDCEDKEVVAAQNALITLANKFHRVEECGVLKPKPTLES
jgi:hypothetical protein